MLFVAFNDMKSKYFSNALRYTSLYVISSIRQPVAQELDKIHVVYARKFCTRLRLNVCWCASETYEQGRPQVDATDAAALGPAPLGPRAMVFG